MQEQIFSFMDSIIKDGWIIAVGVFVLGQIIKTSIPSIDNKYIPLIGGVLGTVLALLIPDIFPGDSTIVCAINGLVVGWAATGGVETVKNLTSDRGTK